MKNSRKILLVWVVLVTMVISGSAAADQYLGQLSNNPYDAESTSNPYGRYGSPYSPDSINNPYGAGSQYRTDSPNNPYGQGLSIYSDDK